MDHKQGNQTSATTLDTNLGQEMLKVIEVSNVKTALLPPSTQRAMASYLQPEDEPVKPWESWI